MNALQIKASPAMEHGRACAIEFKFAAEGDEAGNLSGYGSAFGNTDFGGDVVAPGAFKAWLKSSGARGVPMLWQHDARETIGFWNQFSEDNRGLLVGGRVNLDVQRGREALSLMRQGAIKGLSIGYKAKKTSDRRDDNGDRVRVIEMAELWEVSVVTFPMNPKATVTAVKTMPTDRELEAMLRDEAGLSNRDAKAALSIFKKTLRDGGETAPNPRDADLEAISRELDTLLAVIRS